MSAKPPTLIQVRRRFDASPACVFDAWLDPKSASKWLFATPTGKMVRVKIDAQIGGAFVIVEQRDGKDAEHYGTYLEIDRPRRLVFSFSVEESGANATCVTIDVCAEDSGCELLLTHQIDPAFAEFATRTEKGWKGILEGLAAAD